MRKLWLTVAMLIVCAGATYGQGKTLATFVDLSGDANSKTVSEILAAKIGSTLRYGLTSNVLSATLTISMICLNIEGRGYACSVTADYYPDASPTEFIPLPNILVVGSAEKVADGIFEDFVMDTSDDKLTEAKQLLDKRTFKVWQDGYVAGVAAEMKDCDKAHK
jgi:hypothetical protein